MFREGERKKSDIIHPTGQEKLGRISKETKLDSIELSYGQHCDGLPTSPENNLTAPAAGSTWTALFQVMPLPRAVHIQ